MTKFQKDYLKMAFVMTAALVVPSVIIIILLYFNCTNEQIFWKGVAKTIFGNIILMFAVGAVYCSNKLSTEK